MDRRIASELAIGIVLLISIILGGFFWLSGQDQSVSNYQTPQFSGGFKPKTSVKETQQAENSCKSHYYNGESKVRGWIASSDQTGGEGIVIQIKNEDIQKLPIKDTKVSENFTVRLVDPTAQVKNSLKLATEEKPATITIKGYAQICQQEPPQVSLQQATVAFKKS